MVSGAVWYNSGMEGKSDGQDEIMTIYEGLRMESQKWGRMLPARGEGPERTELPVLAKFRFGKDDFPEEAISASGVSFLLSTLSRVDAILRTPLPEAKEWLSASVALCRRYTLGLANIYLVWTAFFLACDRRFNPQSPVALDAAWIFDVDAYELPLRLDCIAKATAFLSPLLQETLPCEFLAGELRTVQLSAAAFFGVLETVFGLPSVGKCRIGFDRLMQALGTEDAVGLVSNCLRRHRTMQREICGAESVSRLTGDPALEMSLRELKEQNEAIVKSLDDVRADVAQNAKSVAKLDRRMKESLTSFKTMLGGFVRLFRPGQPPSTREKAQAALLPPERYACLSRITNLAHKSQVKAVIDYTWNGHPVSFGDKCRSVYTLSDAVADVWRINEAKWAKVPGTFATERDLRSACYNIAEKADGGVSFNFRR